KKNPAVTTDANPVLPPTPTPEVDSTNEVVVDVPTTDPTTVAAESANKAFPARGNFPFFIKPACVATATSRLSVSQHPTNKKTQVTNACPNVDETLGAVLTISPSPVGIAINPKMIPTIDVIIIP